jgi:peptide chain release factor 1
MLHMLEKTTWNWSVFDYSGSLIVLSISGDKVKKKFKLESGTHRVQRVPPTETKGRRHTSTIAVAVLECVPDYECEYPDHEFRIDTFRASGNGGQSVNTTDSAVRVTHIPTGVTACATTKSQTQNKKSAKEVVLSRLESFKVDSINKEHNSKRKKQIGNMGRGGKFIRNYNFIDSRVTDSRCQKKFRPKDIMSGNLYLIYNNL